MGARDVLGRNELDRINEKSIDLNGYFGSVWSGLDLVLAVTPSARCEGPSKSGCLGLFRASVSWTERGDCLAACRVVGEARLRLGTDR